MTSIGSGPTWLRVPGMLCTAAVFEALDEAATLPGRVVDVPLVQASVEDAADALLARADALPGPVVAVGHSLGAIVVMAAAIRSPAVFAALVLMSTSAAAPSHAQRLGWRRHVRTVRAGGLDRVVAELAPLLYAAQEAGDQAGPGRQRTQLVTTMARDVGAETALRQLALQQSRGELLTALGAVRCPVLVLAGSDDRLCPPARHQAIAAAMPDAELHLVAGAGHLLPVEGPVVTAELLQSWWQQVELRDLGPAAAS